MGYNSNSGNFTETCFLILEGSFILYTIFLPIQEIVRIMRKKYTTNKMLHISHLN